MSVVKVVGMDPSMSNWGIAVGLLDVNQETLTIDHLAVLKPEVPSGKQVRQNSKDLARAAELYAGALLQVTGAKAIFVEAPVGSQSARAMASYGICMGVLGALRVAGHGFIELTPTEVKLAGHGTKGATKQQMIDWALRTHPEAPWPTFTREGQTKVSAVKAEHMADAVAAIHAGLKTPEFTRMLPLLRQVA